MPGVDRAVTPARVCLALWALFVASWCAAAWWTGRATARGRRGQRIGYLAGFAIGFGLLFTLPPAVLGRARFGFAPLLPAAWQAPVWIVPPPVGWGLVAIALAAFAFAWWARLHLGRLWSGMLTLREGHRVVDSGPYALARHPIYTGFIAGGWALALVLAAPAPLVGALVLSAVMAIKARAEERLLRRELGAADYDAYAAAVPMLVPLPPVRRGRTPAA